MFEPLCQYAQTCDAWLAGMSFEHSQRCRWIATQIAHRFVALYLMFIMGSHSPTGLEITSSITVQMHRMLNSRNMYGRCLTSV